MAITIRKKGAASQGLDRKPVAKAEAQPEPAERTVSPSTKPARAELPVAKTLEEWRASSPGAMRTPDPTECSLCEHTYAYPCHGKSKTCMNKKWREREKEKA